MKWERGIHCQPTAPQNCSGYFSSIPLPTLRMPSLYWVMCIHPWASYQTQTIAGCACAGNSGNVFPATAGKLSRHASTVSFEVSGGENVPGIPSACATGNFTYLVRDPWLSSMLCTPSSPFPWKPFSQGRSVWGQVERKFRLVRCYY